MAFAASGAVNNPNNDLVVANPPTDGISSLCFSPKANFLIATAWDNQVRCYEIQSTGTAVPKAATSHEGPVLCSAWNHDGSAVFTGGCDKQAKRWDLATNQATQAPRLPPAAAPHAVPCSECPPWARAERTTQVAAHDAPVRHLAWVPELNMLVTGSWDKTLKYWDLRSQGPALQYQLPERLYAMSCVYPMLVGDCSCSCSRDPTAALQVINLAQPQVAYKTIVSPLKYQTRCLTTFPDKTGYLIGSIEGRVAVQHVDEANASKNFTFKCHRDNADIYSVNSCTFHPVQPTFVTTGSDGCYNFWDKDSKQRLKAMSRCSQPIPCGEQHSLFLADRAYNMDGSIFAYAVSYDWSKGAEAHNPASAQNNIFLHATQPAEVQPRPRSATTTKR